jgi:DNA-binding response OmpR family regulator
MTTQSLNNGLIVAENDSQMRGLIRSVIVHAGQQVFLAADGEEAVALARQFKARLVLLDIAMPRLNGLQACEIIHQLPDYEDVPIIMLTGHDDQRFRAAAQRHGAREFITKPFRPTVLLARLAAWLDIPPELLTPGAKPAASGDATLGGPEVPWTAKPGTARTATDNPRLANVPEVMRIFRPAGT